MDLGTTLSLQPTSQIIESSLAASRATSQVKVQIIESIVLQVADHTDQVADRQSAPIELGMNWSTTLVYSIHDKFIFLSHLGLFQVRFSPFKSHYALNYVLNHYALSHCVCRDYYQKFLEIKRSLRKVRGDTQSGPHFNYPPYLKYI